MISKGTQDYERASKIARNIESAAKVTRVNARGYERNNEDLGRVLEAISNLNCFAAQIANTILGNFGKGYTLAFISSKQAWCIACAVVENNVKVGSYYGQNTILA